MRSGEFSGAGWPLRCRTGRPLRPLMKVNMTKQQFDKAVTIACGQQDLSQVDDSVLHGCALPHFQPATITLEAAAKFIRWHATCLNGQVDSEALNEMRNLSRKKWLVVEPVV